MKENEIIFGGEINDVKVYNMFGQVVKYAPTRSSYSLDVTELPKGNYIVTGTINNEPVSQKILKD
ncbi:T9SS type A sorting domain-containing protein [Chryseobacterium wanjuense]